MWAEQRWRAPRHMAGHVPGEVWEPRDFTRALVSLTPGKSMEEIKKVLLLVLGCAVQVGRGRPGLLASWAGRAPLRCELSLVPVSPGSHLGEGPLGQATPSEPGAGKHTLCLLIKFCWNKATLVPSSVPRGRRMRWFHANSTVCASHGDSMSPGDVITHRTAVRHRPEHSHTVPDCSAGVVARSH